MLVRMVSGGGGLRSGLAFGSEPSMDGSPRSRQMTSASGGLVEIGPVLFEDHVGYE
jgi:hypothetical protein